LPHKNISGKSGEIREKYPLHPKDLPAPTTMITTTLKRLFSTCFVGLSIDYVVKMSNISSNVLAPRDVEIKAHER